MSSQCDRHPESNECTWLRGARTDNAARNCMPTLQGRETGHGLMHTEEHTAVLESFSLIAFCWGRGCCA